MNKLSLLLFTLPLLALSCKPDPHVTAKKNCVNYGTCETAVAVKDFFVFKIGSWWVYEEQTTHERDSLYVTESVDTESADFSVRIYSPREDMYYHYFPQIIDGSFCQPQTATHIEKRCLYVRKSKYSFSTSFLAEDMCFFIQYMKGAGINTINPNYTDNKLLVKDVFNEYTLSNHNFARTVVMHEDHSYLENNSATNHYYARGTGLIRKELLDSNEVWNLVSYYIAP